MRGLEHLVLQVPVSVGLQPTGRHFVPSSQFHHCRRHLTSRALRLLLAAGLYRAADRHHHCVLAVCRVVGLAELISALRCRQKTDGRC
ncbi:hypothetical protein PR002_g15371 [Phytophthora rubi]|uniref:Uncharacterized protein n=1 Tax=Phytophthora rubi TaxID=129364 RepID=A0A6A3KSR4_9STRA|nr:hypothetical protein PR002_g15371 [Phytophthora rubi]